MGAQVDRTSDAGTGYGMPWWLGGVLGGIAGAAAFGALMWVTVPAAIRGEIPALYGVAPTTGVGWAIHLGHGAALGLVFGAVVQSERVDAYLDASMPESADAVQDAVIGVFYGVAVWAILPVVVGPLWIEAVGATDVGTLTGLGPVVLAGHALYGGVLGVVYGATVDR